MPKHCSKTYIKADILYFPGLFSLLANTKETYSSYLTHFSQHKINIRTARDQNDISNTPVKCPHKSQLTTVAMCTIYHSLLSYVSSVVGDHIAVVLIWIIALHQLQRQLYVKVNPIFVICKASFTSILMLSELMLNVVKVRRDRKRKEIPLMMSRKLMSWLADSQGSLSYENMRPWQRKKFLSLVTFFVSFMITTASS